MTIPRRRRKIPKTRKTRKIPTARRRAAIFLACLLISLVSTDMLWRRASPLICDMAASAAKTEIDRVLAEGAAIYRSDGESAPLWRMTQTAGRVVSVELDAATATQMRKELCRCVCDALKSADLSVYVSLADIGCNPFLPMRGMRLTVRLDHYTCVASDVFTTVESVGINQTLYRATARLDITCTMILPRFEKQSVSVTCELPLGETLILGEVPYLYSTKYASGK